MQNQSGRARAQASGSINRASMAQLEELKRRLEHGDPAPKPERQRYSGGKVHNKPHKKNLPPFTPPAGTIPNARGKPVPRPSGKCGHYSTWSEDNRQDLYYVWVRFVDQKPENHKDYCFYLDRKLLLADRIPEPGDSVKCMVNHRYHKNYYRNAQRSSRATVLRVEKADMDYDDFIFLLHGGHIRSPQMPVVTVFKKRRNAELSY